MLKMYCYHRNVFSDKSRSMSSFFIYLKTSAFRQFINAVELQREFMWFFSLILKPLSPGKRRIKANRLKDIPHKTTSSSWFCPCLAASPTEQCGNFLPWYSRLSQGWGLTTFLCVHQDVCPFINTPQPFMLPILLLLWLLILTQLYFFYWL